MNEQQSAAPRKSTLDSVCDGLATLVAVAMVVFQMLVASPYLLLPTAEQCGVHWGFIAVYFLLVRPFRFKGGRIFDFALIILTVLAVLALVDMRSNLVAMGGIYTGWQKAISIIQVLVALLLGFRCMGRVLPGLCIVLLAYALWGSQLTGFFRSARMSVERLACYLMVGNEGMFGMALNTSTRFIFMFVLFGSVLGFIGAGEFFVDIAFALFGKVRGGPAQAAVYSSMLMGMVNGSGPANVVTTGTFTIPLMKKKGFDSDTAGAVEAVASNGGQIMPPVMGAVAFLMADATGIPYAQICLAALVPAVLYYLTLSSSILSYSCKNRIPVAEGDPAKTTWIVLKRGWFYFLPLLALIVLMTVGYSAQRVALFVVIGTLIMGLFIDHKRYTVKNMLGICKDTVGGMVSVSTACLLAGIITGCINITGLGLKIGAVITDVSGSSLLILGLLTAVVSIVLGMGLPTSACYIVLAILVAPAMIKLTVPVMAAHMFILYFGTISNLTPPVALAVFAATGISGGNMWRTGIQAMKMAAAGFIVPFVFLFDDSLLLNGEWLPVALALLTATVGCVILAFPLFGWAFKNLNWLERLLLLPCSIFLIMPQPLWLNGVGIVATALILGNAYRVSRQGAQSPAAA